MSTRIQWILWITLSLSLAVFLGMTLVSQPAAISRTFLPGPTTAGHYQIELRCDVCHTPAMGVRQESCLECHGEELRLAKDTHPQSKFNDPANAALLAGLDARSCTTCHEEHVPERTHPMGLSLPLDYCHRCHQDVAEVRPSHVSLSFDSCASAGCHNFHDNRALYENFLAKHYGESDIAAEPVVPMRNLTARAEKILGRPKQSLSQESMDAPEGISYDKVIIDDWAATAHAAAGVNCCDCHAVDGQQWRDQVGVDDCRTCHERESVGFLAGRHGMRLAAGFTPMQPGDARLPMKSEAATHQLTCSACHTSHRFDSHSAAVDACLSCHNDTHSLAYADSPHYQLWLAEQSGGAQPGSGVSCATCHLPRQRDVASSDGHVFVEHNQNDNLRPNEKMARAVCMDCHGLQFSLDSLADRDLIDANFAGAPTKRVDSLDMAHEWFNRRNTRGSSRAGEEP